MDRLRIRLKKEQYNSEIGKYLFNYGDEIMVVSNSQIEWPITTVDEFKAIVNKLNFDQIEGIKFNYNIE